MWIHFYVFKIKSMARVHPVGQCRCGVPWAPDFRSLKGCRVLSLVRVIKGWLAGNSEPFQMELRVVSA